MWCALPSFLSSITLMGQPAEVYLYGPQMWIFGLATFFLIPVVGYVMIPFFRQLKYTSAYQVSMSVHSLLHVDTAHKSETHTLSHHDLQTQQMKCCLFTLLTHTPTLYL